MLRDAVPVQKDEVIDATRMDCMKLRAFFEKEIDAAKADDILWSLHVKATMMKVSDPIMFGHAVRAYYNDVFDKHGELFDEIGVDPNNGIGDVYAKIADLPEALDGLRIVQISDAHLGSFLEDFEPVKRGLDMINALEPDLLCFTGDLVNDHSDEAEPWIPIFRGLQAKYGKFSILGNHDYADYARRTDDERERIRRRIQEIHGEMGFDLLLDEHPQRLSEAQRMTARELVEHQREVLEGGARDAERGADQRGHLLRGERSQLPQLREVIAREHLQQRRDACVRRRGRA